MSKTYTIWCNALFPDEVTARLVEGTSGHRLILDEVRASNLGVGGGNPALAEADIAFGQPDPEQLIALKNVQWTQLTSAGYTRYDREDLQKAFKERDAQMTNSSSVFNEPCAQHLLAFMLGEARQLPQSMAAQLGSRSWEHERLRPACRVLQDEFVVVLGYGAIARRLIELLQPFRLHVSAFRRRIKSNDPNWVRHIREVDVFLPSAHHIVNTLPSTSRTDGLIDAEFLSRVRPGARLYNVGRGTTVDQPALIEALQSGRLSAAYLDVTDPEPLPSDHPLWTAPNCFITPHIAGGFKAEFPSLVEHFLANLRRFEEGEPLVDRIV